jgi:anthranilate synthase component 2
MILLVDNYDSFTYNLCQMVGALEPSIEVARNDSLSIASIERLAPTHIILSPGPGRPADAGICPELIRSFAGRIPLLGVCLGHQAICEVFGAKIGYAQTLMHGKASEITLDTGARLFYGLPVRISAARYHSLVAEPDSIPATLRVTATSDDGEVMAVEHQSLRVYGLQFHPESILTPQGRTIVSNFLSERSAT